MSKFMRHLASCPVSVYPVSSLQLASSEYDNRFGVDISSYKFQRYAVPKGG